MFKSTNKTHNRFSPPTKKNIDATGYKSVTSNKMYGAINSAKDLIDSRLSLESFHTCETIFTANLSDNQCSCIPKTPALDTSAQLAQNTSQEGPLKNFKKRARTKYVTNTVLNPLLKLRSPLENSYKTTEKCSAQLTEADGKLTGLYCNQRWCLVCARIRTARLITGYMPALQKMEDKWFLTLTRKNVPAHLLKATIREMLTVASSTVRKLRRKNPRTKKRYLNFSCLRKIECTYNEVTNEYHPHFHFIIDSETAARCILHHWLSYYGSDLADPAGQDLRPADDNSCMELFKYFTKVISKTKDKKDYRIHVSALDQMFRAMKKVRTFQPTGVIKAVSEDIDELQAEATGREVVACWSWLGAGDWVDKETGEMLTGYVPSLAIKEIASHIVMPKPAGKFNSLSKSNQFDK
jgi:Replication protein